MSVTDEIRNQKRKHSSKRNAKPQELADWSGVNASLMLAAVRVVSKAGGAVRFGYTRDGGAYAIGIYGDGDKPYTDYVRPHESVDEYLIAVYEEWNTEEVSK